MPPWRSPYSVDAHGVLAARALHRESTEGAPARRHLRPRMGLRLRPGLQLTRCVRGISPPEARVRRRAARDPNRAGRRLRDEGAMSFRLRVTLLTAAAVAVAAIGASVAMYFVVQDQLITQVDKNLEVAAQNAARGGRPPERFGPQPFMTGRSDIWAQIITANGDIFRSDLAQPATGLVPQEVKDVASGNRAAFHATAEASNARLRIYVVPIQNGGAIETIQDLELVDGVLNQTRLLLIAFSIGAIVCAGALGVRVAR